MRRLVVNEKTGFRIINPEKPVIIRDNRGLMFYTTEPFLPNVTCFNLPGLGEYRVECGNFVPMDNPVDYPFAKLPPLVRREYRDLFGNVKQLPLPYDFKIVWGSNPAKCTIKWNDKVIFIDNSFKEKPLPQVFFILYHEYAHAYFEEETICDQLAGNYMKFRGFNPSQIGNAPILALSTRQRVRKNNMKESILATS